MSPIRIVAALLILSSLVALFAIDNPRLSMPPLILGNLLVLFDDWRAKRTA